MDEDSRQRKLAHNEYLLKQVNREIERLTAEFAADGLAPTNDSAEFFCACGSPACNQTIELRLSEYERVRRDPDRFILVPGHEHREVERVVEQNRSYVVVEKLPDYRLG